MARLLKIISILMITSTLCFTALYIKLDVGLLKTLAISCGTTSYHFIMRLAVGAIYEVVLHNRVNYERRWFRTSAFENKLYGIIRVKHWKKFMPTYNGEVFDIRKHSLDEIAQAMCQAELVHETIFVLSFLPLAVGHRFDAFEVFLITSLVSAGFDLLFVIIQRYNRPRIMGMCRVRLARRYNTEEE